MSGENPFVLVSERGAPFSVSGLRRMIERAAQAAGLEIKAHPHMLRHATGYALANQGTDTRTLQALEKRTAVPRPFHHERAKRRRFARSLRADFARSGRSLLARSKRAVLSLVEKGGTKRQSTSFGAHFTKPRSMTRQLSP